MSKYQKQAALFSLLSGVSIFFGLATKNFMPYAPVIWYFAGFVLIIIATINAVKASIRK